MLASVGGWMMYSATREESRATTILFTEESKPFNFRLAMPKKIDSSVQQLSSHPSSEAQCASTNCQLVAPMDEQICLSKGNHPAPDIRMVIANVSSIFIKLYYVYMGDRVVV